MTDRSDGDRPKPVRRRAVKRGAMVLGVGMALNFALNMGRSILIARLLTVADYGIAGTFMAALNLLQMMSNFSFQLLIVQDRRGNDEAFGAAIKGLNVARQILLGCLLIALGGPIAQLMGQPDLAWAYRCMAVVPFVTAFRHQDLVRLKRQMLFGPQMINNIGAQLLGIAALWPAVVMLGDYRILLVFYAVQALGQLVGSHLQAERRFHVGWDWSVAGQALRFGWPLMASGFVLFFVMQGDRIIVANFYSAEDLGLIAVILAMVMPVVQVVGQLVRTYFLPVLARHQDKPQSFDERAVVTLQLTLCMGLAAALGFAILGPPVIVIAFGAKYAAAGTYVAALAAAFAVQMVRSGSTTVALARGNSLNNLFSNLVRIVFFVPAVTLAAQGADLVSVILVGVAGQVAGMALSVGMLYWRTGLGAWHRMRLPCALALASFAALAGSIMQPDYGYATPGWPLAVALGGALLTLASCRSLATEARMWLRRSPPS